MVQQYTPEAAPGFAKHSSSFKNDERCYAVVYFTGEDYNKVFRETYEAYAGGTTGNIDYDVAYSYEGGMWVGVVVRDYETT